MAFESKKGIFDIKLVDGPTIGPMSMIWGDGNYIYACFDSSPEGQRARNECDWRLLSHGVLWMALIENSGVALQDTDEKWWGYSGYSLVGETQPL